MITICCTSKLLKRTKFPVVPLIPEPTTALGNWYANILFFQHRQILLFTSERSRLAVVTPARETRLLAGHLIRHLSVLLDRLEARPQWIEAEIQQMADVRYAAAKSKSVLGTMNDYKYQIEAFLPRCLEGSEVELELYLSVCPSGPLQYKSPDMVTLDLLRTKYDAN